MSRPVRLAAVLLPLLGLGALWGQSHHAYNQGTEWDVPIMGYDPRDILRGHYVEFTYDWPGLDDPRPRFLCIEGAAPRIDRVDAGEAASGCAHPLQADSAAVYGLEGLVRGRLYVGQDRARALERRLADRDQRAIVTIRQRADGSLTPIGIRFRPLTAGEMAEREAQRQRAEESPPPPAIMTR